VSEKKKIDVVTGSCAADSVGKGRPAEPGVVASASTAHHANSLAADFLSKDRPAEPDVGNVVISLFAADPFGKSRPAESTRLSLRATLSSAPLFPLQRHGPLSKPLKYCLWSLWSLRHASLSTWLLHALSNKTLRTPLSSAPLLTLSRHEPDMLDIAVFYLILSMNFLEKRNPDFDWQLRSVRFRNSKKREWTQPKAQGIEALQGKVTTISFEVVINSEQKCLARIMSVASYTKCAAHIMSAASYAQWFKQCPNLDEPGFIAVVVTDVAVELIPTEPVTQSEQILDSRFQIPRHVALYVLTGSALKGSQLSRALDSQSSPLSRVCTKTTMSTKSVEVAPRESLPRCAEDLCQRSAAGRKHPTRCVGVLTFHGAIRMSIASFERVTARPRQRRLLQSADDEALPQFLNNVRKAEATMQAGIPTHSVVIIFVASLAPITCVISPTMVASARVSKDDKVAVSCRTVNFKAILTATALIARVVLLAIAINSLIPPAAMVSVALVANEGE